MSATLIHPTSTSPILLPGNAVRREPLRARSSGRRRSRGKPRVTPARLLEILNARLAREPESEGLRLGARQWVVEEGTAGCNWSETSLIVRVHGSAQPGSFARLRGVLADVRAEFDLDLPASRPPSSP